MQGNNELGASIKEELTSFSGTAGIVVASINGDTIFRENPGKIFPAASLIKLLILWAFFSKVEDGSLSIDQKIQIGKEQKVEGSGIIKELHEGLELTLKDLATLMIILSDNVATNILIDLLSVRQINTVGKELGLNNTLLGRKMMDFEAQRRGVDNYSSPEDIAKLLNMYVTSEKLSKLSRDTMLEILLRQQCNNKLSKLLPEGIRLAHKTGELPGIEHDAGIFFFDDTKVIAVVMTGELKQNTDGISLCATVGDMIYKHYAD